MCCAQFRKHRSDLSQPVYFSANQRLQSVPICCLPWVSLFVTGHWSFVARCWILDSGFWLFVSPSFKSKIRIPHSAIESPLPLLMSLILANDSDYPLATNDLTLAAYLLYRCPYFHLFLSLNLNQFFFDAFPVAALKMTGPSAVIATVCSKWADKLPSSVTAVHPSSKVFTS